VTSLQGAASRQSRCRSSRPRDGLVRTGGGYKTSRRRAANPSHGAARGMWVPCEASRAISTFVKDYSHSRAPPQQPHIDALVRLLDCLYRQRHSAHVQGLKAVHRDALRAECSRVGHCHSYADCLAEERARRMRSGGGAAGACADSGICSGAIAMRTTQAFTLSRCVSRSNLSQRVPRGRRAAPKCCADSGLLGDGRSAMALHWPAGHCCYD
jgi:hypothetical protein